MSSSCTPFTFLADKQYKIIYIYKTSLACSQYLCVFVKLESIQLSLAESAGVRWRVDRVMPNMFQSADSVTKSQLASIAFEKITTSFSAMICSMRSAGASRSGCVAG